MEDIILWATYQDVVTWFIWKATSRTTFITWCDRVMLTPAIDMKESVMREALSFDITALRKIDDWCSKFFKAKQESKVKKWWPEIWKMWRIY